MAKRYPPERKERRAGRRCAVLTSLAGMDGVPWFEDGRLWLLGPTAPRPADPAALARALLGRNLPGRSEMARLIGARRQIALDISCLAGWARDVAELEAQRDLEAPIAEGVRPLCRYRGVDVAPASGRVLAASNAWAGWSRPSEQPHAVRKSARKPRSGPNGWCRRCRFGSTPWGTGPSIPWRNCKTPRCRRTT